MAAGLAVIGIVQGAIIAGLVFRTPATPASTTPSAPPAAPASPASSLTPEARAAVAAPASTVPETQAPAPARAAAAAAAGAVVASSSGAANNAAVDGLGRVRIVSAVALQVTERGRVVGTSGERPLFLSPGAHTLELSNSALGFRTTERVRVEAGGQVELPVALPNGTINVNAQPWAQVFIDGAAVGDTPLANVSLVIGDHEVVFRHPQFGERRQRVVVKAGALTRVSASFAP
jgi:hypothetical protein